MTITRIMIQLIGVGYPLPPSPILAGVTVPGPPAMQVLIAVGLVLGTRRVEEGTQSAPEVGVDELAVPFPSEVGLVRPIIHGQEEVCQFFR